MFYLLFIIPLLLEMCSYNTYTVETEKGTTEVYFEKQAKFYCLVHTVNNILQSHVYVPNDFIEYETKYQNSFFEKEATPGKDNLDQATISQLQQYEEHSYSELIPYYLKKGLYYFGNFSINTLYFLMNKHEIELIWVDNEKTLQQINTSGQTDIFDDSELDDERLIGFIINAIKLNVFNLYQFRHFYAIRKIEGVWFLLDSKQKEPIILSTNKEVNKHLLNVLKNNKNEKSDNYIIKVLKKKNNEIDN